MRLRLETDSYNRLICTFEDTGRVATASHAGEAAGSLDAALREALASGLGECFWQEACGEYRWMLRRNGDRIRIAVMWSSGIVTGWENVHWEDCDAGALAGELTRALSSWRKSGPLATAAPSNN